MNLNSNLKESNVNNLSTIAHIKSHSILDYGIFVTNKLRFSQDLKVINLFFPCVTHAPGFQNDNTFKPVFFEISILIYGIKNGGWIC